MYFAVNVFASTGPFVGTVSFQLSNSFVVSLHVAVVGICPFTASLSHPVPVNTSITLYLFSPSIVLFSPASKVTLIYPFGISILGSVPIFNRPFKLAFASISVVLLIGVPGATDHTRLS